MHNGFFIVAPMFFFVIGAIQIRDDDDDDDKSLAFFHTFTHMHYIIGTQADAAVRSARVSLYIHAITLHYITLQIFKVA